MCSYTLYMPNPQIKILQADVNLEPLDTTECEDCERPATHAVVLDLRNAGTSVRLGAYCRACGTRFRNRIRGGLKAKPNGK